MLSIFPTITATTSSVSAPTTRTSQPIVTGTTVIGIKYADGVMLAADTLASYGSLARYNDVRRLQSVGKNTLIGASGEISDFQAIMEILDGMTREDINQDDGYTRYYIQHNLCKFFCQLFYIYHNKKGNDSLDLLSENSFKITRWSRPRKLLSWLHLYRNLILLKYGLKTHL
jgi:20S proteasome subunit beta 7